MQSVQNVVFLQFEIEFFFLSDIDCKCHRPESGIFTSKYWNSLLVQNFRNFLSRSHTPAQGRNQEESLTRPLIHIDESTWCFLVAKATLELAGYGQSVNLNVLGMNLLKPIFCNYRTLWPCLLPIYMTHKKVEC